METLVMKLTCVDTDVLLQALASIESFSTNGAAVLLRRVRPDEVRLQSEGKRTQRC